MKPKNAFLALHLGELDGFPMALYRFISRTYSVLSVRHKICLEMLVTLEAIIMSGERTSPTFGTYKPWNNLHNTILKTECSILKTEC